MHRKRPKSDRIHLCLPVLLIHVTLLLHLPHGIAILLNVDLMGCTLNGQAIHLLAQLENVTLVLAKTALNTTHPVHSVMY